MFGVVDGVNVHHLLTEVKHFVDYFHTLFVNNCNSAPQAVAIIATTHHAKAGIFAEIANNGGWAVGRLRKVQKGDFVFLLRATKRGVSRQPLA